ncbi:MAG: hypothetical protein IJZ03_06300 [Clostridia bacterium]|nr:hypothetical protein [Clostridia bacterium]
MLYKRGSHGRTLPRRGCLRIIEGREKDVEAAMTAHGLRLCDTGTDNDWYALVFEK